MKRNILCVILGTLLCIGSLLPLIVSNKVLRDNLSDLLLGVRCKTECDAVIAEYNVLPNLNTEDPTFDGEYIEEWTFGYVHEVYLTTKEIDLISEDINDKYVNNKIVVYNNSEEYLNEESFKVFVDNVKSNTPSCYVKYVPTGKTNIVYHPIIIVVSGIMTLLSLGMFVAGAHLAGVVHKDSDNCNDKVISNQTNEF